MSNAAEESKPTYRAFISYSHHDITVAKHLHRRLERYRIPKRLVGSETLRGPMPARLTPIFRDIDELPAADDLSAEIKAALAASGALIVVCSPHARVSRWVGREIETFRALHGDARPVLAALVDGEPEEAFPDALLDHPSLGLDDALDGVFVGGKTANVHPSIFPRQSAEIRVREPVAADFRKDKDGAALADLKLIAGLTGASLSALVQRDAQARLRRVTAITVTAALAVIVMAALTWTAIVARNDAQRQRIEAEGLVEYMLTDLRDRLKGVGRLDVMTAVNERAMRYYGGQDDLEDMPPDSLDRRARILQAMGEDDVGRADPVAAKVKFLEARRTTRALRLNAPDDDERRYGDAISDYWVGYVAYESADYGSAEPDWTKYRDTMSDLAKRNPDNVRFVSEAGLSNGALCSLFHARKQLELAEVACLTALKQIQRSVKLDPNDSEASANLRNRTGWLANVYRDQGKFPEARSQRVNLQALIEAGLQSDPNDATLLSEKIVNLRSLAAYSQNLLEYPVASQYLELAQTLADRLARLDPANAAWREQSIRVKIGWAGLYRAQGKRRPANNWIDLARKEIDGARLSESALSRIELEIGKLNLGDRVIRKEK